MAKLWSLLRGKSEERMNQNDWAPMVFGGNTYPLASMQRLGSNTEEIENDYVGYVQGAYKSNGVVYACMMARMLIFSEARFQWQRMNGGRPGDLFGNNDLQLLEKPWPKGTTGDLLARAIQDVDLAGNFYVVTEGFGGSKRLRRLRPDWVQVVLSAPPDKATRSDIVSYIYKPGGPTNTDVSTWEIYPVDGRNGKVAHWSPIPDPEAQYLGMSWLTPVLREIRSDKAATLHKAKFFENAATPNLAVTFSEQLTLDQFKDFMEAMDAAKGGVEHAYETLYLGGGANVSVVGADLRQLDFKATQGAGETRIAAAAGVHPVLVGLSEGLAGSALNAGNYKAVKESFASMKLRPLWRSFANCLEVLVNVPSNARLWYDDRDIAFLRTDRKELAEIQQIQAATINSFIMAGYKPDSAREAVVKEDLSLLEHTGLYSVQLLPPGQGTMTSPPTQPAAKPGQKPGAPATPAATPKKPAAPPAPAAQPKPKPAQG